MNFLTGTLDGTGVSCSLSISINSVIADSFVNENFGDNMITLAPDDVKKRFWPRFSTRFLEIFDECSGIAETIEQCHTRGTMDRDAMKITANPRILPVNFGAIADTICGQAIEAAGLYGDSL